MEGLAGAFLVNTYADGVKAFNTAKGVFRFAFFTCICAPSINAAIGIAVNYFVGQNLQMSMDFIRIRGARTHNLKNVNLDLPRN